MIHAQQPPSLSPPSPSSVGYASYTRPIDPPGPLASRLRGRRGDRWLDHAGVRDSGVATGGEIATQGGCHTKAEATSTSSSPTERTFHNAVLNPIEQHAKPFVRSVEIGAIGAIEPQSYILKSGSFGANGVVFVASDAVNYPIRNGS